MCRGDDPLCSNGVEVGGALVTNPNDASETSSDEEVERPILTTVGQLFAPSDFLIRHFHGSSIVTDFSRTGQPTDPVLSH